MKLSVVIPTYNRLPHLRKCLDSVMSGFKDFSYEVIVADGGSNDGTLEYLRGLDNITLIDQGELIGVVKTLNICFKIAKGEYLYSLADDCIIIPDVIQDICVFMDKNPNMGLVGPKMQETKYNNMHNVFNLGGPYWVVSPKAFVIRRSVLDEIGYLDENFRTYYIDIDTPLMVMNHGYSICISKKVGIVHNRSDGEKDLKIKVTRDKDFVYVKSGIK